MLPGLEHDTRGKHAEEGAASAMGTASTSFIRHCEETWEQVTSTIDECVPDQVQEKPGLWQYPHDKALHAKSKLRALRDRYDAKVQDFSEHEQLRHCKVEQNRKLCNPPVPT